MRASGDISGKRVLITLDAVGGVWRFALDLARSLKHAGMIVTLAGFGPPPSQRQAQEALAVDKLIWLDAPLDWTTDNREALRNIPALLKDIIVRERIDILHLNLPSQAAGLNTPVPTIAMSHSCVTTWFATMRGGDLPDDFAWHYDVNREGLQTADIVIAPSESHAALLKKTYGDIGPVSVVHNACDLQPADVEKENFILAAGRWWDEGKNGRALELAAANLRWPLLFAGADEGPLGEHTGFTHGSRLGQLSRDQIIDLMRRAAIFVSPSRYEPFGLAALEAARCGCALVLADIPTYRELWQGAALFADPASPNDFLLKLEALIADRQATEELAERSYRRSLDYSEERQATGMIALYQRAIASTQVTAE